MSGAMQIVLGLGVLLVFLGVPWCSLGVHFGGTERGLYGGLVIRSRKADDGGDGRR